VGDIRGSVTPFRGPECNEDITPRVACSIERTATEQRYNSEVKVSPDDFLMEKRQRDSPMPLVTV